MDGGTARRCSAAGVTHRSHRSRGLARWPALQSARLASVRHADVPPLQGKVPLKGERRRGPPALPPLTFTRHPSDRGLHVLRRHAPGLRRGVRRPPRLAPAPAADDFSAASAGSRSTSKGWARAGPRELPLGDRRIGDCDGVARRPGRRASCHSGDGAGACRCAAMQLGHPARLMMCITAARVVGGTMRKDEGGARAGARLSGMVMEGHEGKAWRRCGDGQRRRPRSLRVRYAAASPWPAAAALGATGGEAPGRGAPDVRTACARHSGQEFCGAGNQRLRVSADTIDTHARLGAPLVDTCAAIAGVS
jgi:hypothetical protein